MADEADTAADIQAAEIANALAAHAARSREEPRAFCADCGDLIPHKRRALMVATCVPCQIDRERSARIARGAR